MPTEEPKKPEEEKPALPEGHRDGVSKGEGKKEEKPTPVDNLVESQHTVTIDGNEIKYTVVTGTMVLKEETADREKEAEGEKPKAQVFFTAYTRDGVKDKSKRPVTFSFNGGPGSASVWMHLGMLGPLSGSVGVRWQPAAAALPVNRQRVLAAGRNRPGFY